MDAYDVKFESTDAKGFVCEMGQKVFKLQNHLVCIDENMFAQMRAAATHVSLTQEGRATKKHPRVTNHFIMQFDINQERFDVGIEQHSNEGKKSVSSDFIFISSFSDGKLSRYSAENAHYGSRIAYVKGQTETRNGFKMGISVGATRQIKPDSCVIKQIRESSEDLKARNAEIYLTDDILKRTLIRAGTADQIVVKTPDIKKPVVYGKISVRDEYYIPAHEELLEDFDQLNSYTNQVELTLKWLDGKKTVKERGFFKTGKNEWLLNHMSPVGNGAYITDFTRPTTRVDLKMDAEK